jgi:hypothetical protein
LAGRLVAWWCWEWRHDGCRCLKRTLWRDCWLTISPDEKSREIRWVWSISNPNRAVSRNGVKTAQKKEDARGIWDVDDNLSCTDKPIKKEQYSLLSGAWSIASESRSRSKRGRAAHVGEGRTLKVGGRHLTTPPAWPMGARPGPHNPSALFSARVFYYDCYYFTLFSLFFLLRAFCF